MNKSRCHINTQKVELRQKIMGNLVTMTENSSIDLNSPTSPNKNPNLLFNPSDGVSALEQASP